MRVTSRAAAAAVVFAACAAVGGIYASRAIGRALETELPSVPPVNISTVFRDLTPLPVTITANWQKVSRTVTVYELLSDKTLWRRMHFDDWDAVPEAIRERALDAMWNAYSHLVGNPHQWDSMNAEHWDEVPQPIRAQAFIQMMRYWSGRYNVGESFGLPRGTVTNTMNAIVMAESWFEHRAISISRSGNRDLGLAQMSDFARDRLRQLCRAGRIDFAPGADAGYFDPWQATRMAAIWFELMLAEQDGDLEAAIRSYHLGAAATRSGEGEAYLANVLRIRRRYMRAGEGPPTWNFLATELEAFMRIGV